MGVGITRRRDYDCLLCGVHDSGRDVHVFCLCQGESAKQLDEGVPGYKWLICGRRRVRAGVDGDAKFAVSDETRSQSLGRAFAARPSGCLAIYLYDEILHEFEDNFSKSSFSRMISSSFQWQWSFIYGVTYTCNFSFLLL